MLPSWRACLTPGTCAGVSLDGETLIFAGSRLLFRYRDGDAGARNVAVAVLRQLGYGGQAVAQLMGLTVNYVATLHNRALREGTGGVVRPRGRPGKLEPGAWQRAQQWRAAGVRDAEIARRLQVEQSTVLRRLGPASAQDRLPLEEPALRQPEPSPEPGPAAGTAAADVTAAAAGARAGERGGGRRGRAGRRRGWRVRGRRGSAGRAAGVWRAGRVPVCGRDAAARLRRPGRRRGDPGRRGGRGAR